MSKQESSRTAVCCFCRGSFSVSKRTAEHIIPKWLLRDSGVVEGEIHSFKFVTDAGVKGGRNTSAYSHVYRRVCSSCNSGWLGALESDVQRIFKEMRGEAPSTLAWTDRLFLNAWAYKVFALTHLTEDGSRAQLVREEDLFSLTERLLPEGRCFLAIARTSELRIGKINLHLFQNRFITTAEEAKLKGLSETQCFVGMLRIFDLLLLFAYVPPGDEWGLEIDRRLARCLPIWPGQGDIIFDKPSLPDIVSAESMKFHFFHPKDDMDESALNRLEEMSNSTTSMDKLITVPPKATNGPKIL
jgi:hypothetical protein